MIYREQDALICFREIVSMREPFSTIVATVGMCKTLQNRFHVLDMELATGASHEPHRDGRLAGSWHTHKGP